MYSCSIHLFLFLGNCKKYDLQNQFISFLCIALGLFQRSTFLLLLPIQILNKHNIKSHPFSPKSLNIQRRTLRLLLTDLLQERSGVLSGTIDSPQLLTIPNLTQVKDILPLMVRIRLMERSHSDLPSTIRQGIERIYV